MLRSLGALVLRPQRATSSSLLQFARNPWATTGAVAVCGMATSASLSMTARSEEAPGSSSGRSAGDQTRRVAFEEISKLLQERKYRLAAEAAMRFRNSGVQADARILSASTQAFRQARRYMEEGLKMYHDSKADASINLNVHALTNVIGLAASAESVDTAVDAFKEIERRQMQPNVWTFNNLMDAYSRAGDFEAVVRTYKEMEQVPGLVPTAHTYVVKCLALSKLGRSADANRLLLSAIGQQVQIPQQLYRDLLTRALTTGDPVLLNTVLTAIHAAFPSAMIDEGSLLHALNVAWRRGRVDLAEACWQLVERAGFTPSVHLYDALAGACGQGRNSEAAFRILGEMSRFNYRVSDGTLRKIVRGIGRDRESVEYALTALRHVAKDGLISLDAFNALLQAAAETSDSELALSILASDAELGVKADIESYNAAIASCSRNPDSAVNLYNMLPERGVTPNDRTYVELTNCHIRSRRLNVASALLKSLRENNAAVPAEAYAVVVRRAARTREFGVADEMLSEMSKVEKDPAHAEYVKQYVEKLRNMSEEEHKQYLQDSRVSRTGGVRRGGNQEGGSQTQGGADNRQQRPRRYAQSVGDNADQQQQQQRTPRKPRPQPRNGGGDAAAAGEKKAPTSESD